LCDRTTIHQDLSDWQSANRPLENAVTYDDYGITIGWAGNFIYKKYSSE